MIEGLPGGFPVQRREHGDVVDGPGGQLGQHVIEIIAQIDLQALAGLHDRKDRSDFGAGFLAPDMQPIPATDGERTQSILAEFLIDLDAAIFQENWKTFKRDHWLRA